MVENEFLKNCLATLTLCPFLSPAVWDVSQAPIRLVIHGSTGTITPEQEKHYNETLTETLIAGYAVLKSGRTRLKGVVDTQTALVNM